MTVAGDHQILDPFGKEFMVTEFISIVARVNALRAPSMTSLFLEFVRSRWYSLATEFHNNRLQGART